MNLWIVTSQRERSLIKMTDAEYLQVKRSAVRLRSLAPLKKHTVLQVYTVYFYLKICEFTTNILQFTYRLSLL